MISGVKTFKAYHALIDLNKDLRKEFGRNPPYLSPKAYARELGTVHINIGRRTLKTSFILDNADNGDLIIAHNRHMVKALERDFIGAYNGFVMPHITTLNHIDLHPEIYRGSLKRCKCCGVSSRRLYKNIWIDEPEHCFRGSSSKSLDPVYEHIICPERYQQQTIIKMGE